ncbi:MAG: tRNA (adenosine(37)-N6)-dimethylallyltransferase MiaA [Arcobacteraceae bacterium]|nr:tRNA (adenosine(37)-N6)-dimethylallyltransferase MiaA [Arcobacteraceae bacterium]
MKQIAIIAPTASGKSALSIEIAHKTNSVILSLDSLSVYKEIDIASAKPTIEERDGIKHFGIDEVYPNEAFDVIEFIALYIKAKQYAMKNEKNLIIVGGTGFYLKALIDGISSIPNISVQTKQWVESQLKDLKKAYEFISNIDKEYMKNIASTDKYRIERALLIYKQSSQTPSVYFKLNPPKPVIVDIDIYEIEWLVEDLRKRIAQRTKIMLNDGVIDEVIYLEKKYTRKPSCMNTIGICETLEYLDGKVSKKELEEKITTNTARLAKRQRTFNNGQFRNIIKGDLNFLKKAILNSFL